MTIATPFKKIRARIDSSIGIIRRKRPSPSAILGFSSSSHDPAIAIVNERGSVVFAQANERCLKLKRAWHTPPDSLPLLNELDKHIPAGNVACGLSWTNRSLAWTPVLRAALAGQKRLIDRLYSADNGLGRRYLNELQTLCLYKTPSTNRHLLQNISHWAWKRGQSSVSQKGYEHHICHAVTACLTAPFDNGLCIVLDGMGEGRPFSLFRYEEGEITPLAGPRSLTSVSIGVWYSMLCWAAGFDPIRGEEWKVMGLAATGTFNSSLHKLLSPMIQIKGLRIVASPDYFYRLTTVLQIPPELRPDLAHTGQRIFEEKVITLLNNAHHAYPHTNLIYSGGCALNSSCNGKILGKTPFTRLHIPMAPADDGNALGAALLAWKDHYPLERPPRIQSPYMGSIIDGVTLDRAVAFGGHATRRHASDEALCEEVAQRLANGHLVGWVQGRAEFGPRALGNRSILADPRCERVKDKINGVVKFRESFRPFAPAILHEYGPSYFKNYQYSPFMERTLLFSDSDSAPGVVHDDGTGRLQSVTKENNPLFYALLLEFYKITGLPMLLNTSFNVMGRPIMHDVEDALSVFYTSGLDTLVIDSNVFDKRYHNADEGI